MGGSHKQECSSSSLLLSAAKTVSSSGLMCKNANSLSLIQQVQADTTIHKQAGDAPSVIGTAEEDSEEKEQPIRDA